MARQPIVGSDNNTWGTVLNQYLSVSLDSGGFLNNGIVTAPKLSSGAGTSGQVLGTDGTNLQWVNPNAFSSVATSNSSTITFSGNGTSGTPLSAVVADSSITVAKLAFDPATQAELDAHTGATSAAHAASAITFTPTGSISATNVQDAIAEVVNETPTVVGGAGVGISTTGTTSTIRAIGQNIQEFTANGIWTKPANAISVDIYLVGGGGGGGSGRRGAAGTNRYGGNAGNSAATTVLNNIPASLLPATAAITVGSAGTAGAAVTTNDTDGNSGGGGNYTTFGSLLQAAGGGGGGGGKSTAPTAQVGGVGGNIGGFPGALGSNTTGAHGGPLFGQLLLSSGLSAYVGVGGGGGGLDTTNAVGGGGYGGLPYFSLESGLVGVGGGAGSAGAGGANGGVGLLGFPSGGGAGGSAGDAAGTVAGGKGGNGARGAGGGGGGASTNGANSGAGGTGGAGFARIVTTLGSGV